MTKYFYTWISVLQLGPPILNILSLGPVARPGEGGKGEEELSLSICWLSNDYYVKLGTAQPQLVPPVLTKSETFPFPPF